MSGRLLNEGEHVVFTTRTHPKALFVPVVVLVLVLATAGYLSTLPDGAHRGALLIAIWVVAAVVLAVTVLWPFLNWLATTYTVTNRRLVTREGVLTRRGHDIPINRISDVSTERSIVDRMFGCGTLVIADASTHGQVSLHDVPRVERLQLQMSEQLFHGSRSSDDDGT